MIIPNDSGIEEDLSTTEASASSGVDKALRTAGSDLEYMGNKYVSEWCCSLDDFNEEQDQQEELQ